MKLLSTVLLILAALLTGCASPDTDKPSPVASAPAGIKPSLSFFTASPNTISAGQKATLKWEVKGSGPVRIDPELGKVGLTGSIEVRPYTTTTYTLTAGESAQEITGTATVNVVPGPPVIDYFVADPPEISFGTTGTLKWNVINATSVSIDNNIGTVAQSGILSVGPPGTTVYTLTAKNTEGSVTASVALIHIGRPWAP